MRWTEDMKDRLRALWEEGRTAGEIAPVLGVSRNGVLGAINRFAMPRRSSPIVSRDDLPERKFERLIDIIADFDPPFAMAAKTVGLDEDVASSMWLELCERGGRQYA